MSKHKNRPILEIPRSEQERLLDSLTIIALALLILLPALSYGSLPEEVPTHFNGKGEADAWSSKSYIWLLPGIGVLMAILMQYLTTIPHHYSYKVEVTAENAPTQYQRARTVIRFFNAFDTALFLVITWFMIQAAKGEAGGMNEWMMPSILMVTLFAVVYAVRMAYKKD
ncbi:MAG: DUF1648 domain-containing protein [Bacteroidota bacterium]